MTQNKGLALQVSQYLSEFFANNEFISPETFTQITFDSIKESNPGNYELTFVIPSIKSLQTRIPLEKGIVDALNMSAVTTLYNKGAKQIISSVDINPNIIVKFNVEQADEDSDAQIVSVTSNVDTLSNSYKIHPMTTAIQGSAIKVFGNQNPERFDLCEPYIRASVKAIIGGVVNKLNTTKKTFKSWDVAAFNPSPNDIKTITKIYQDAKIHDILDNLKIAYKKVQHFEKVEIFKHSTLAEIKAQKREQGMVDVKDVADSIVENININTQPIDDVGMKLSAIRNNDIARTLKIAVPQALIEVSQTIYEIKKMFELYADSMKSLNEQEVRDTHIQAMRRLLVTIEQAISQLNCVDKLFANIIN